MVEYVDWGGRGFNMATVDCGPLRGPLTQPGGRGGRILMAFTRWEAPRCRGDALLFSRRSSSTENSVVVTTLYASNINLATCPP